MKKICEDQRNCGNKLKKEIKKKRLEKVWD